MAFHHSLLILAAAVFLLIGSTAADISDECGLAVYWGQNALEGSLKDACDSGYYKYVAIESLHISGTNPDNAVLNIPGHCDSSNGGCTYLADEIEHCKKKDIKVLLSLTGSVPQNTTENGAAEPLLNYLVNTFLKPGESNEGPFGSASVDGFDFKVTKGPQAFYFYLSRVLGQVHNAYLTASPECRVLSMESTLRSGLYQKVWVQLFNEPSCDFSSGIDNVVASINHWMTVASPETQLFLSLAASPAAAQTGYIPPELLNNEVLPRIRYSSRYGGVALWNRYYDQSNNYSPQIIRPVCDYTYPLKKKSFISQVVA